MRRNLQCALKGRPSPFHHAYQIHFACRSEASIREALAAPDLNLRSVEKDSRGPGQTAKAFPSLRTGRKQARFGGKRLATIGSAEDSSRPGLDPPASSARWKDQLSHGGNRGSNPRGDASVSASLKPPLGLPDWPFCHAIVFSCYQIAKSPFTPMPKSRLTTMRASAESGGR